MGNYKIDLQKNKKSVDGSIMGKIEDFQRTVFAEHENLGLNLLKKSPLTSRCDREVSIQERHVNKEMKLLMFASNSYIGATIHFDAVEKAIEVTREYGIGSGGVPLLSGTTIYQNELEQEIAKTKGFDDAIVFSSGFTANIGTILGLVAPNNLIVHDKLNHASLIDGTIMSGAKMVRHKHNDVNDLEKVLKENINNYPKGGILVVTDGVFSMDGDIANIPEILEITRKYEALLLIDDAHSTGQIGKNGAGTLSYFNITDNSDIIVTGTLSKAIGTVGGFVAANQKIIDYLRIFARSNMYSTSLPPSVCAAATEVFKYMKNSDVVTQLQSNSKYLRDALSERGYNIMNTETGIVPIIVGDEHKLTMMSKDFTERGIMVNYIFPPVVSPKLSRLRISVMASHTRNDLDRLIRAIDEVFAIYSLN